MLSTPNEPPKRRNLQAQVSKSIESTFFEGLFDIPGINMEIVRFFDFPPLTTVASLKDHLSPEIGHFNTRKLSNEQNRIQDPLVKLGFYPLKSRVP
ncbi:hypothetical protein HG531_001014 [Fusarium graminearum]|nr:hypothetical protein HG531_001014 [Fusarium graminearum]